MQTCSNNSMSASLCAMRLLQHCRNLASTTTRWRQAGAPPFESYEVVGTREFPDESLAAATQRAKNGL